jgi:hypothetical protein
MPPILLTNAVAGGDHRHHPGGGGGDRLEAHRDGEYASEDVDGRDLKVSAAIASAQENVRNPLGWLAGKPCPPLVSIIVWVTVPVLSSSIASVTTPLAYTPIPNLSYGLCITAGT